MEEDFDPILEPSNTLTEALAEENETLLELALAQDEKAAKPQVAPRKKRLSREMAREALTRIEDAAKTQNDFEEVIKMWDKLDQNEIRRVSNHEIGRGDIPLEWGMAEDGITFPRPESAAVHQAQRGDFLDMIYDCPFEMHELVEDPDISKLISQMKEDHKEILYDDDDPIIRKLIHTAETLCEGTLRKPAEPLPITKVAALFAVAYLYEHRENANMDELTRMLRYILAAEREVAF